MDGIDKLKAILALVLGGGLIATLLSGFLVSKSVKKD